MKNFTYSFRAILLFVLFSAGTSTAFSQQIEKSLVLKTGERIGFLEYKPKNYATEGNVKHPVIIFLHGIGERGNGTTELKNNARVGLPRVIRDGHPMTFTWNGKTETFLVVSPQCPTSYGMWPQQMVDEFVTYVKTQLRSDTNRIYLTGLSMGGGGSNRYISNDAKAPKKLAATAAICTPCTFSNGKYAADANMPYWGFHAADDAVVPASCTDRAVDRITASGAQVKPLKTIWPTGGHVVWDRVYTDTNYRYDGVINIYEWFLGQNKSLAVNKLPVANAGADLRVSPQQASVVLNGAGSRDSDGKLVRYVWKKISGPNSGNITAKMGEASSTTITKLNIAGVYKFELAVVDDRAGVSRDTVTITVAADAPLPTAPKPVDTVKPVTPKPVDTVKPVTPKPVDTVKPVTPKPVDNVKPVTPKPVDTIKPVTPKPVDPVKPVTPKPVDTIKPVTPKPADTVKPVTPKPVDPVKPVTPAKPVTANKPPIARTQGDIVVPIEWNWAPSVSGSPSTDSDGWIALFTWEKISGPASFKIVSPRSCATKLENLVTGIYVFRVTAFDNKGASSTADVKVTITKKETKTTVASKSTIEEEPLAAVPVTVLSLPAQVTVSPNPAVNMVNLQYTSGETGKSFINVHDVSGKLIKSIVFNKTAGLYKHNLDISQLVSGVYYVQVQTGNAVQLQTKFVKR